MKFLVDAQLPRRLAYWLVAEGHDVVHTLDLPAKNKTTDNTIRAISIEDARIVITKDTGFSDSFTLIGQPYKLLLVTTGNISNMSKRPRPQKQRGFRHIPEDFRAYELACVENLVAIVLSPPHPKVEKCETPDALFNFGSTVIGVEVVDFVRGQLDDSTYYLRRANVRELVADSANSHFGGMDQSHRIYVAITWRERRVIKQSEANQLGQELASIVISRIPQVIYESCEIDCSDIDSVIVRDNIFKIFVMRLPDNAFTSWTNLESDSSIPDFVELQEIIRKKDEKYPNCRQKCSEVWLLISVMGKGLETNTSMTISDCAHLYQSAYDRVYLYFWTGNSVQQLNTAVPE